MPVAHPWLREVPEAHQPGPPKAEGNQKELAQAKLTKERPRDPIIHCKTPPSPGVGAQGPLRMEQGGNRPGCPLTPDRPPRAGEAPSPPRPALQVVWRGCRLRRPQTPHLKHHAQEHQVPLTWHLGAPTPRQRYLGPLTTAPSEAREGWGGVLPFCHDWGGGRGRGGSFNPTRPHHAQPAPWGGDAFFGHAGNSESRVGAGGWQQVWL